MKIKLLKVQELAVIVPLSGPAVLGTAVLFSLPLFVGSAARAFNLDSGQQGVLAAMDIAGASIAGSVSILWIQRWAWRSVGAIGVAGMVAFNIASLLVNEYAVLCLVRVFAGFCAGTIWAVHLAAIGSRADPDRAFSASIIMQMAVFAVGTKFAAACIERWEFNGIVYYLIGLTLLCAPGLFWVSNSPQYTTAPASQKSAKEQRLVAIASFVALGVYTMGVSAVWAFTERIGDAAGLSLDRVASAISTSFFVSMAGPLVVYWLGASFGLVLPLLIGFLATIGFIVLFQAGYFENYGVQYLIAVWGFQLAWQFLSPLQLAVVSRADIAKRLIAACPLVLGIGASLGPPIAGFLVRNGYFGLVLAFGIVSVVTSALLVLPSASYQQRQLNT